MKAHSHRTAIHRKSLSKPMRILFSTGPTKRMEPVLDFGCGHGTDVRILRKHGLDIEGYDPHYQPLMPLREYTVVTALYVLNVLTLPKRREALQEAWGKVKPGGSLIVAVRTHSDVKRHAKKGKWAKLYDGYITGTKTFQHGFSGNELLKLLGRLPQIASHRGYPLVGLFSRELGPLCAIVRKEK